MSDLKIEISNMVELKALKLSISNVRMARRAKRRSIAESAELEALKWLKTSSNFLKPPM